MQETTTDIDALSGVLDLEKELCSSYKSEGVEETKATD